MTKQQSAEIAADETKALLRALARVGEAALLLLGMDATAFPGPPGERYRQAAEAFDTLMRSTAHRHGLVHDPVDPTNLARVFKVQL